MSENKENNSIDSESENSSQNDKDNNNNSENQKESKEEILNNPSSIDEIKNLKQKISQLELKVVNLQKRNKELTKDNLRNDTKLKRMLFVGVRKQLFFENKTNNFK